MYSRPRRGLATYLVLTLVFSAAVSAAVHVVRLNAPVQSNAVDSLDPNDCSRGIDEANQEACDVGGGQ